MKAIVTAAALTLMIINTAHAGEIRDTRPVYPGMSQTEDSVYSPKYRGNDPANNEIECRFTKPTEGCLNKATPKPGALAFRKVTLENGHLIAMSCYWSTSGFHCE